jgi:Glycosyl hydrolase family 47
MASPTSTGTTKKEANPLFDGATTSSQNVYKDDPEDVNHDATWNDEEEHAVEPAANNWCWWTLLILLLPIVTILVGYVLLLSREKVVYPYDFVDPSDHVNNQWTPLGGLRYNEYSSGDSPYVITAEIQHRSDALARLRRAHVKAAMEHAWLGYTQFAFGMDEVKPISQRGDNIWQGLATTMVDALDTLWLLNMTHAFWQARDFIASNPTYADKNVSVICFETTIRSLGGMLSAFYWSKDAVFLDRAFDIAQRIAKSFQGSSTGIPYGRVNLMTGEAHNDHGEDFTPLSWVGTLQLEFRWLDAFLESSNNHQETKKMRNQVENIVTILHSMNPPNGLYPTLVRNVNVTKAEFANQHLTFGANGDSFYEYLLKTWIQGGKKETVYRDMYDKAIQGLHGRLLQKSTPSGLTYLADIVNGVKVHKLHHLTCFMGGLLALGSYTDPTGRKSRRAKRDMKTAKVKRMLLWFSCFWIAFLATKQVGFSHNNGRPLVLTGSDLYMLSNVCPTEHRYARIYLLLFG